VSTTAGLLLLAQKIDVTQPKSAVLYVLACCSCALCTLACPDWRDYRFARFAELPCYVGENGAGEAVDQVENLLRFIAVRAVAGSALGMNAVPGPFGADGADVERFFCLIIPSRCCKRHPWIHGWVRYLVLALNLRLWGLGGYLKGRADANATAEILD